MNLQDRIEASLPEIREKARRLIAEHGDHVLSQVTVSQIYGGMRGVRALVCDTSSVDPERGLILRGHPVADVADRLPEEIFFLLCTGALPAKDALLSLQAEIRERYTVPAYVFKVLEAMPAESHPMTMLDTAILVMQEESQFAKKRGGGARQDHWKLCLEDALTLIGRLPAIAAGIYRMRFNKGPRIGPDRDLDWSGNYAHMMGIPDPNGDFKDLVRLYLVLHSDHESGNVSAHAGHLVGSAGSDLFYAASAALNGLAGPLHGLASQECLGFVLDVMDRFGGVPSDADLRTYVKARLAAGEVIPGYGHAVLRCDDPRFTAFIKYGDRVCEEEKVFRTVKSIYRVVPPVLAEMGKVKDPHPNVDAASGALLHHFGVTELSYYTVLFGLSRTLGIAAQYVLDKAFGAPIERPKSVTTDWISSQVS